MWCGYAFYTDDFGGKAIQQSEWAFYYGRAEEVINIITRNQIPDDITALPAKLQKAIKRAVCYQADYFAENGVDIGLNSDDSFTVGKVSVNTGNETESAKRAKRVCPAVIMLLEQTGLLNRDVGVLC